MYNLKFKIYWLVCGMIVLLFCSGLMLLPTEWFFVNDGMTSIPFLDKVVHCAVFFSLVIWFSGQLRSLLVIFFFISIYGFLIEGAQHLISYKDSDWMDIFANEVGVLLGIIISSSKISGWSRVFEDRFLIKK